jgi:hypothetical protein
LLPSARSLVGGLQLSSIGDLTGDTPRARIWATIGGIAAAGIGIAIAIAFISRVLQPMLNSFRAADKDTAAADRALAEPLGMTYAKLKETIAELDAAVDRVSENTGADSTQYRDTLAAREAWEETRRGALRLIGTEILWTRYRDAKVAVIVAIFLVLGGVVAFAWGANPPDDEKENAPVTLGQAPLLLDVHLTSAGADALRKARGCLTADVRALSIGGTATEREVVTVPPGGCRPVRFVLTSELGTAVAAARP